MPPQGAASEASGGSAAPVRAHQTALRYAPTGGSERSERGGAFVVYINILYLYISFISLFWGAFFPMITAYWKSKWDKFPAEMGQIPRQMGQIPRRFLRTFIDICPIWP